MRREGDVLARLMQWMSTSDADIVLRDAITEIAGLRAMLHDSEIDIRDTFAAAALCGLIANGDYGVESTPMLAYGWADAMLRERAKNTPSTPQEPPMSDPASTTHVPRKPDGDRLAEWERHGSRRWGLGVASDIYDLECRVAALEKANHDAAPAATAVSEQARTDKAAPCHRHDGTGDTPASHATPGDGTSHGECTEPVAFGIECDGELLAAYTCEDEESAAAMVERFAASGMTGHVVVPLYRSPPVAWQLVHDNERLRDEVMLLKDYIRRLAEQDATLSLCEGNVTVEIDGTLTYEERAVIQWAVNAMRPECRAVLQGLLDRTK